MFITRVRIRITLRTMYGQRTWPLLFTFGPNNIPRVTFGALPLPRVVPLVLVFGPNPLSRDSHVVVGQEIKNRTTKTKIPYRHRIGPLRVAHELKAGTKSQRTRCLRPTGHRICTYGIRILHFDLGLRRAFQWKFVVADVAKPIISTDFKTKDRFSPLLRRVKTAHRVRNPREIKEPANIECQ